jgi:hypothetical protein
MSKKATASDAELILKLYDLRREAEIRKARNWAVIDFWPQSLDDVIKIASALGTQENAWMRQVGGYWNMAASLCLAGTVSEDLFLEPSFSGEMFLIFSKVQPFLKEWRAKMKNPHIFSNVEKLCTGSKRGRDFLVVMQNQLAARREAMMKAAKAS